LNRHFLQTASCTISTTKPRRHNIVDFNTRAKRDVLSHECRGIGPRESRVDPSTSVRNPSTCVERYFLLSMNEKDEQDLQCTPPDVKAIADDACTTLIPARSRDQYEKAHGAFVNWCSKNKVVDGHYTESVLLAYISELSKRYASSTLWSIFSMLKKTILVHCGRDLTDSAKVVAFIKRKSAAHTSKKSESFSREHINLYLKQASDDLFLHVKIGLLLGLFGACRKSELAAMNIDDVKDHGDHLMIKIPKSKTGPRSFVPVGCQDDHLNGLIYFRKYLQLRPENAPSRLFLYFKGGRCTRQPIGINTIAKYPKMIAEFLDLPHPEKFTSHAIRRTAATWMSNNGVGLINLKRFGGWRSDTAAQGYIAESDCNKKKLAHTLIDASNANISMTNIDGKHSIPSSNSPSINISGCSNFSLNIEYNK
jgi:integrase